MTNITPNHLNWHTGMEEYIAAKKNIFSHSVVSDVVLNAKNEVTAGFAKELDPGRVILFSAYTHSYEETSQACPGARCIYERDGSILWDDGKNAPKTLLRTDGILLPGRHNIENYMTALGLANGFVTEKAAREVAGTFPGVEHRLEFVRTCKGVRYYNSSIDSSPTRTAAALSALREKPIVICGGYDKQIPFEPLADALAARAKAVVLTGATAPKIMDAINRCGAWPAQVSVFTEPDFKKAVLMASGMAKSGDTVLLSPACASFDAFPNFEARGRYFKEIVSELPDTDLEHTTSTTHRLGSEEP